MILLNDHDVSLYERMAAELRQVAADLRRHQDEALPQPGTAHRLEQYASAINTNLRVELA